MFCGDCGSKLKDELTYCVVCGSIKDQAGREKPEERPFINRAAHIPPPSPSYPLASPPVSPPIKHKSNKITVIAAVLLTAGILFAVFWFFGLPLLQERLGSNEPTTEPNIYVQNDDADSDSVPQVSDDPPQETIPEVPEYPNDEINDPPEYFPSPGYDMPRFTPEQLAQGDMSSPWHPIHFTDVRAPQPLHPDIPYGYIAVNHIRHLNDHYYERFPFSYQEKRAAAWLVGELLAMGYVWDDIEVQEFHIYDVGFTADRLRWSSGWSVYYNYDYMRNTHLSQNVVLTVPGQSDQVIVVGAHYDTVLYPGASDNASGTALLLESAQRMRHIDNYYTIVYVFFGAEEVGLLGAYHFVNIFDDLDRILFMINADVLFEGPYFIFGGGYSSAAGTGTWSRGEARSNDITRQWERIARELNTREGLDLRNSQEAIFLSSDQLVFLDAGITVMMLYGTDFDSRGMDYFRVLHSYRDCYHYIMERWPYKIDDAMRTFSIFLERVLLESY